MDFVHHIRSMDLSTSEPALHEEKYADDVEYQAPPEHRTLFEISRISSILLAVLICIVAIAFFITILAKKELRSLPTSWLVINVLVADIINGLILIPVVEDSLTGWRTGEAGCHFFIVLATLNGIHFQIALLLLLIERFTYFMDPSGHASKMTARHVQIMIISSVVTVIAVSVASTYIFNRPDYIVTDYTNICTVMTDEVKMIVHIVLVYLIPILSVAIMGLVALCCTCVKCNSLTEDRSNRLQALALILLIVLFDMALIFPRDVATIASLITSMTRWLVLRFLSNLFYLLAPIIIMVLIPEIRIAMGACCKREKKGESTPLVKPM